MIPRLKNNFINECLLVFLNKLRACIYFLITQFIENRKLSLYPIKRNLHKYSTYIISMDFSLIEIYLYITNFSNTRKDVVLLSVMQDSNSLLNLFHSPIFVPTSQNRSFLYLDLYYSYLLENN